MSHLAFPMLLAPEQGLPEWLIKALLVFFFIGLPILRSLRETLKQKKALEQRRGSADAGGSDSASQMDEARRRWEALMRGEESAPPARPAAQAAPPPVPRPTAAEKAAPAQLAGQLSDFQPSPTEDEVEAAADEATADPEHFIPDEETRAREENERRLREEREARMAFLQRERESGAGRRTNVASDPMTSLGAPTAAATIQRAARPNVLFGDGVDAAARRAALRRAILANEVLGSPAALRDPAAGPVGLRRPA